MVQANMDLASLRTHLVLDRHGPAHPVLDPAGRHGALPLHLDLTPLGHLEVLGQEVAGRLRDVNLLLLPEGHHPRRRVHGVT